MTISSNKRKLIGLSSDIIQLPNLIEIQQDSFDWFIKEGIKESLMEIFPVDDFTGKSLTLKIGDYYLDKPVFSPEKAMEKGVSYSSSVKAKAQLVYHETKKIKEEEVFICDMPLMTERGTFIVNGNQRVIVNQLTRSPGIYFSSEIDPHTGRSLAHAEIRPQRGIWIEFETSKTDLINVRIDRRKKLNVITFLRAFGFSTNEEIRNLFKEVDTDHDHKYIEKSIAKDSTRNQNEAYLEIYSKLRPGEPAVIENAKLFFDSTFLNLRRYHLSRVGRYKINKRLGLSFPEKEEFYILKPQDIVSALKQLIELNNGIGEFDDIDHLSNRRVRAVGELIQGSFRIGLLRLERIIKERMSVAGEIEELSPATLVNARPIIAALNEFFGSSQLSQFMDQTNPLHQLEHLRRLSVYGPGGITKERGGFSVRDVHPSYYSRICPVKAPEGPSVGLLSSLSLYAKINDYGFIEAPYRKVKHENGKSIVLKEIDYLMADEEEDKFIAEATINLGPNGEILEDRISVRFNRDFIFQKKEKVDYVDVLPQQMVGISASLIPFVSSDAGRFPLMGANMQGQAVPLIKPQASLVGTNMEKSVIENTDQSIQAPEDGTIVYADGNEIHFKGVKGKTKKYRINKFERTNQDTCYNQRVLAYTGQKVKKGQILMDGACSDNGELALGVNLLAAYMPWEGFNYDDSVVISERLVKDDVLTSIHIDEYEVSVMDTKLGPEEITQDIPNVSEESLRNLAEDGIVYIGAKVNPGDILVGKIAPKGETELSAEERLLRAIFGEKAREIRDTSLRMPYGERGIVIDVNILSKKEGDSLPPGVLKIIKVKVAQKRKVSVGDKVSGRHGSKGIIAKILPEADMPYLEDGSRIDIILNPLSIIARMNVGQVVETHLGWAAGKLGVKYAVPVFGKEGTAFIKEELKKAGLPENGKVLLYDGRTGETFNEKVTIGDAYVMKLIHLVEDKVHARSTGPYSLITQQPLGGKAQMGGQRLGEMEVWALEAYGAAYTLQEMLTIKSDDIQGRAKAFESIVKGLDVPRSEATESFKVLVKELNGLGLNIETIKNNNDDSFSSSSQEENQ